MAGRGLLFRFVSVFVLLAVFTPCLRAGLTVRPGFKLGAGASSIFGQDAFQQDWQASLSAGIFVELLILDRLAASPELNFVRKGSIYRLDSNGLVYREKYLFDYLEVPVLMKYYLNRGKKPEFYFCAGPSVALNLRARLKVTFDDLEETVEVDNLKGTDILINAGAGAALSLKPGWLLLEFRCSHGLKSVATEPQADLRNKSLILLVGFKF